MSGNSSLIAPGLAAIFDMDGVIIHSTPMHNRAWEIYLARFGVPADGVQERMHGLRNDQIVRDWFGPGLDEAAVFEHGAAKERLYRELMAPVLEEHLVAGVRETLDALGAAPMAVASNAETPNIDFVLDGAGLRACFRHVVDGHQVERPKPAPDIYVKAAELLGVAPADCIVFEDSLAGIEAARSAGARVVGLTTTLATLDGVAISAPDFTDAALLAWLRAQRPVRGF